MAAIALSAAFAERTFMPGCPRPGGVVTPALARVQSDAAWPAIRRAESESIPVADVERYFKVEGPMRSSAPMPVGKRRIVLRIKGCQNSENPFSVTDNKFAQFGKLVIRNR